jgi:hypothetical protein
MKKFLYVVGSMSLVWYFMLFDLYVKSFLLQLPFWIFIIGEVTYFLSAFFLGWMCGRGIRTYYEENN